jgi:Ca-activated chloride channel family protein
MQRVVDQRKVLIAAAVVTLVFIAAFVATDVAGADGLIIVPDHPDVVPGHFSFAPLEVSYHHVSVRITDQVAVTTIDQEFSNPGNRQLEGTYVFPLPAGAVIDRFSMDVNGKMTDAELLPADKARALYEDIVRRALDPALLEYTGRGAFKARIFPIEPHSRKRVRISYTELLSSDGGLVQYLYPLNTEKFSSAPVHDVSVTVTIDGRQPLKSVWCPSHDAEVRREGDRTAVVGWEAHEARPDTDFKVVFARSTGPLGIDLLASRQAGEDGFFLLLLSPGLVTERTAVAPKDVCFLLDTSGSMAGTKIEQAKKALAFCIAGLDARDRFEVVRFSTDVEPLFGGLAAASKENTAKASAFVSGLQAVGGTAIAEALDRGLALRGSGGDAGRTFQVIFLTDGLPTVGETDEDTLVARVERAFRGTRVFSFGIGTDVNTHLLDRVASRTRGTSRYVLSGEDIELAVSGFWTKASEPVLSGIEVSFTNPSIRVTGMLPVELPDLFNGDQLVVFGRYSGSGPSAVRVAGSFGGERREFTEDVQFPAAAALNPWLPRLWAARRVGWLLDEIRLRGESRELVEEVTQLARAWGIVTPYTAYLVLEDEARRGVPAELRTYRELEQDRDTLGGSRRKMDSVRAEAKAPAARSGEAAVDNALAVQLLAGALNEAQAVQGAGLAKAVPAAPAAGPVGYKDEQARNYATQVRVLNGRAFYQNGATWTDSTAQGGKALKQQRVRFASEAWFGLLARGSTVASWLSLGANVDVVVDGVLYQVREN